MPNIKVQVHEKATCCGFEATGPGGATLSAPLPLPSGHTYHKYFF